MKINVLADANWEAKLDHANRPLQIRQDFEGRDYGVSLREIVIVLNSRDPNLRHKQRIRFSRTAARLTMDVMLPLDVMARSSHSQRRSLVAQELCNEVSRVLRKYRFESFDTEAFLQDFSRKVETDMLGPDSARFDYLCAERAPDNAD